jgi:hypothetical protein
VETTPLTREGRVRVVVATTILLSFISFWRAAAIVLADLDVVAAAIGTFERDLLGPRRDEAIARLRQQVSDRDSS